MIKVLFSRNPQRGYGAPSSRGSHTYSSRSNKALQMDLRRVAWRVSGTSHPGASETHNILTRGSGRPRRPRSAAVRLRGMRRLPN